MNKLNDIITRMFGRSSKPKTVIEKFSSVRPNSSDEGAEFENADGQQILKPSNDTNKNSYDPNQTLVKRRLEPMNQELQEKHVNEGEASHKIINTDKYKTANKTLVLNSNAPSFLQGKRAKEMPDTETDTSLEIQLEQPISIVEYKDYLERSGSPNSENMARQRYENWRARGWVDADDNLIKFRIGLNMVQLAHKMPVIDDLEISRQIRAKCASYKPLYKVGQFIELSDLSDPEINVDLPFGFVQSYYQGSSDIPYDIILGTQKIATFQHEIRAIDLKQSIPTIAQQIYNKFKDKDRPLLEEDFQDIDAYLAQLQKTGGWSNDTINQIRNYIKYSIPRPKQTLREKQETSLLSEEVKQEMPESQVEMDWNQYSIVNQLSDVVLDYINKGVDKSWLMAEIIKRESSGQYPKDTYKMLLNKVGQTKSSQIVTNKTPTGPLSQEQKIGTPAYGTEDEQETITDSSAYERKKKEIGVNPSILKDPNRIGGTFTIDEVRAKAKKVIDKFNNDHSLNPHPESNDDGW